MRIRNSHPGVFWSTTTFVNVRACPSGNKTRTVVLRVFIQDVPFEKNGARPSRPVPRVSQHVNEGKEEGGQRAEGGSASQVVPAGLVPGEDTGCDGIHPRGLGPV